MKVEKIDSAGTYQPFPGMTVVAAIRQDEKGKSFWHNIYQQLEQSSVLNQYFSLLPFESYHITAVSLDNINSLPDSTWQQYVQYIDDNVSRYQQIQNELQTVLPNKFEVVFGLLREDMGLILEVRLPEELVMAIHALARKYGYEKNIPSCFHITLAYPYKQCSAEAYTEMLGEIKKIDDLFRVQKRMVFESFALCSHQDMTEFSPWKVGTNLWNKNGNPFANQFSLQSNFFQKALTVTASLMSNCIFSNGGYVK